MYITKTLAMPKLDYTDCLKIVDVRDFDSDSVLYSTIKYMIRFHIDEFDISDDELLAHICIREGLFTYKEWQALINDWVRQVSEIDYKVDSSKKRLNLIETVYQISGCCGRVSAGGYKMISALTTRTLIKANMEQFEKHFGAHPNDYIIKVWQELDTLLKEGIIVGEYTDELLQMKHP